MVRDAILASPAWPDIAAQRGRLDDRGIDVARILFDAHAAGMGVDQAVAAGGLFTVNLRVVCLILVVGSVGSWPMCWEGLGV
ncbi:hypothetical protein [Streptomyces sp. A0592]|uniref:hypothetical protein n=1 Tax=Streptomyces sp. A0592 TaxID=2563099 RepID=UPI00109E49BC|nr:hypothetical protein [Streptomyces sp. A0592]THA73507.1 hypothetical protein E6U81_39175 [Streptomyces sp. A0592]